ncbi:thioredoxin [Nadsonia fulvescens var. elongata DSM 6958]|uniref:Thioredoxin n=1 Tax=Nadsonia fulvescens var. elongata DSM 6958 TaxID=857566 RepID=A0A1E3PG15_9ASCO|nr:thioredoxin [Nadsonia fulvescens var. elongata DSM 6958]
MVNNLKNLAEFNQAIAYEGLTVIDFYAVWCGPCKMIAPTVEKFSNTFTDAHFYKVDVDEASDIAAEAEVSAMPTFLLYKNGQKVSTVVGANPPVLQKAIKDNL